MKKQSLTLVALAASALFSIGAIAQPKPLQSDRSFNSSMFYAQNMPMESMDMMVSKEQYMKEMENRWMMAEKMQGTSGKPGWVKFGMLKKAMEQPNVSNGGGAK
ncbi:MAG: hypothetical protein ABIZ64_10635 [Casimicrobium sp.]|jgi:hypothetical protein